MSQQNPVQDLSFIAAEDLSADAAATTSQRYRALRLDSVAKQVEKVTAATDIVIGVQQNLPALGQLVDVAAIGTTKARAGGAIAFGARVKIDAAGKFVSGGAGADRNWGIALEATAADGDLFEMMLTGLVVT